MLSKLIGSALTALAALLLLASARADEEKVPLNKVPKAVMDSVKARFPGAKLLGASTEKEGGKTVYEVSLTYKKHHVDVTAQPDGKLLDIEKEIARKDLPKAVSETLAAKYGKAKYKRVEELSKANGKVHGYEVLLTTNGMTIEVVLSPAGKILREEKQKKGEK